MIYQSLTRASNNPQFAQIYWTKYLQPRQQAFAVVIELAKTKNEIQAILDPALVFDTMEWHYALRTNLSTYL